MKRVVLFLGLLVGVIFFIGCGRPSVLQTIQDGGEWFLRNQDESFIYYQYEPLSDVYPDSHHSAREFGALWSIIKLADFLEDSRYDDLAARGWSHFSETFVRDEVNGFTYVNITTQKIKLSYNAFAILVLLELEIDGKENLLAELAKGILFAQMDSGELDTFYYSDRETGTDYYPGQALLALMSLYEAGGNEAYLAAVGKALPYYSEVYWAENPNTAFVPWQTQAFYKYYLATGSEEAVNFIFAMNDFMVETFAEDDECARFDMDGGIVMAVYVEGVNKAYTLADALGDEERKKCYGEFIREGAEAVMDLQFPVEGQDPEDFSDSAFGGFYGSLRDLTMQVDRNQHAVMALMGAYELGLAE